MSGEDYHRSIIHPGLTTSTSGTFYFAYGSNLSITQMRIRCDHNPDSSRPIALARLDVHSWIICQRGYANVVRLPPSTPTNDASTVWGLLYNMSPEDESRLDLYEGHDPMRNSDPVVNPDPEGQVERPYLQGNWDYNKQYLAVTVTKWLVDPTDFGVEVPNWQPESQHQTTVRVLVYVDEVRTKPGAINWEYIGRMNRGIRESVALGLPESWVNAVMRKDIPAGVEVDDDGYVGTADGYVEVEATEAQDHVAEKEVKEWHETNGHESVQEGWR